MPHSVEDHLRLKVTEYDRVIRTFIPGYDAMLSAIVQWLERIIPANGRIVDLGGGTGSLAYEVAQRIPRAIIQILDIDPKMLSVAKLRLSEFGDRIEYSESSFDGPLPECNAVVSTLALHHVRAIELKSNIYSNILHALAPNGILLVGDVTISTTPHIKEVAFTGWREFMRSSGMKDEEITNHFHEWAEEDTYFSLEEEFEALRRGGFSAPECFWKSGPTTVFGGTKL